MESRSSAVLGSGDWVMYDGGEHQVVALAGTSVRLRSAGGTDTVVLAAYLMASPGSAVVDGASAPTVEPFGLLDALPDAVIDAARVWEQYVVEVQTGLPPGAVVGAAPRPGYDPATTTVMQRDQGKAAELGVSVRTVQLRRVRYAQQGLWGLVDQCGVLEWEATGRADARLVAAVREVIEAERDTSTGTRSRLIRRVVKAVEAAYGPGVVPIPSRSSFYKLIETLATGRHTFGSAITRRQSANRPQGMFTPTLATRPGEQVQIDSTPIDVMVLLATFETWDPAGRLFDAVVAGQAWHWVDQVAGAAKAAQVLRPGGRLAVFGNVFDSPPVVAKALTDVYRWVAPDAPFNAQSSRTALDIYQEMFAKAADGIAAAGGFDDPEQWRFDWEQSYTRDQWLDQLPTTGGLTRFPPDKLAEVLDCVGAAIDTIGGSFTMTYTTLAATARTSAT